MLANNKEDDEEGDGVFIENFHVALTDIQAFHFLLENDDGIVHWSDHDVQDYAEDEFETRVNFTIDVPREPVKRIFARADDYTETSKFLELTANDEPVDENDRYDGHEVGVHVRCGYDDELTIGSSIHDGTASADDGWW